MSSIYSRKSLLGRCQMHDEAYANDTSVDSLRPQPG